MSRVREDRRDGAEADAAVDAPLRRSARRRSAEQVVEDNGDGAPQDGDSAKCVNQPPEASAEDPNEAVSRRTRFVSRKLRRANGNPTPSECCFCPDPNLFDGKEIESELIGPFVNRRGQAKLFVHFDCACWAPQVFTDVQTGQLRRVFDEYCRGRKLKCSECGGRGATIGCYVQKCKHVFHLRCLATSGARKVDRYFVAFCENHAHLSDKKSYQILLEAATIADVAAAHRRQDSTFGLDAPHSKYTQLRRRETEFIFSSKLRICSHTGAFETTKVVFSHKQKRVLSKTDRLSASDHARALLISAFDIASGRLAYMSVAGRDKSETMTAVEARAALASRETSSLLLLRNLRRAPMWTTDQITVTQRSDDDVSKAGVVAPALETSSLNPCPRVTDTPASKEDDVTSGAKKGNSSPEVEILKFSNDEDIPRRSKRRHITVSSSDDDESPPISHDKSEVNQGQSVALPTFRKAGTSAGFVSPTPADQNQQEGPPGFNSISDTTEQKKWLEKRAREEKIDIASIKKQRVSLQVSQGDASGTKEVPGARQGLVGKVKSAWETFLEEQLPKERLLRPDDNEAAAMRNMARLWSLLSPQAREEYQERARRAAYEPVSAKIIADTIEGKKHLTEADSDCSRGEKKLASEAVQRLPRANDLGLFAGREGLMSAKGQHAEVIERDSLERRQPSVSLPRRGCRGKGSGARAHYDLVAVDWDDLLPTSLDEKDLAPTNPRLTQNEKNSYGRVRNAPLRSKKPVDRL